MASPLKRQPYARAALGPRSMGSWPAMLGLAVSSLAAADSGMPPKLSLAGGDLRRIEKVLGEGVIGAALPAPAIDRPADYLPLLAAPRNYHMLRGPHAGTDETHWSRPKDRAGWRLELSSEEAGFLTTAQDGSLVMAGIENLHNNALTRYAPGEPFLPRGLSPGAETVVDMNVKVFDLEQPDSLQHEGFLKVSLRHLGAYRISVPGGQFDTVLLKAHFSGNIGPAEITDVQYRFFAKEVGLVAMVEQRDVSAFVVYHDRQEMAKVLGGPIP